MTTFLPPGDPASLLTVDRRRRDRDALASGKVVDVVVIGGGATGTGIALDAATRGLSVALIEAHDLANGTSRWSSKLIHGGLRYLATGQVGVAWESAAERAHLMMTIAPHLIHAVPQLVPEFHDTPRQDRLMVRAGWQAGDMLRRATGVPASRLPRPRHICATQALRLAPTLPADRLTGAMIGWDGQAEDDARLVIAIARTAAAFGAKIITYASAESIGAGGVVVRDQLDGGTFTVNARHVVNATGVWASELDDRVTLRPSRGTHVVLRSRDLQYPSAAITVPVPEKRGRYIFALPQADDLIYVGLTDVPVDGPVPDVAVAPIEDVEWILAVLSQSLARPIGVAAAVGSFVGFRPLLASSDTASSADISRHHAVIGSPDDVLTITGGKLTTYRRMAQDLVDRLTDVRCRTTDQPLIGAGPIPHTGQLPTRLARRYGSEAPLVAALADHNPELLQPIGPAGGFVDVRGVELLWGIAAEGATSIDDLLERRTRIALVPADLQAVRPHATDIVAATFPFVQA